MKKLHFSTAEAFSSTTGAFSSKTVEHSSTSEAFSSKTVEYSSTTEVFSSKTEQCSSTYKAFSSKTVECSSTTEAFSSKTDECSSTNKTFSSITEECYLGIKAKNFFKKHTEKQLRRLLLLFCSQNKSLIFLKAIKIYFPYKYIFVSN